MPLLCSLCSDLCAAAWVAGYDKLQFFLLRNINRESSEILILLTEIFQKQTYFLLVLKNCLNIASGFQI
jgi:hypothetical protein